MINIMYLVIVLYSGSGVPIADLKVPYDSLESCSAMGQYMNEGEMLGLSATLRDEGYHFQWDCLNQEALDLYNQPRVESHEDEPHIDLTMPIW